MVIALLKPLRVEMGIENKSVLFSLQLCIFFLSAQMNSEAWRNIIQSRKTTIFQE